MLFRSVISILGSGGMGEVYRARDLRLGRDVAIKVLANRVAEDNILRARIEREARVLAAVNHPAIATIFGGRPAGFVLPDSLSEGWHLAPGDSEESFWQKLRDRL